MAFYDQKTDTSNFVVSWTGDPKNDFGVFAKGYMCAAEHLARTLLRSPRFSDYEAYPVVFLYRHALELSLKHVIYRCSELGALRSTSGIDDDLKNNHRLPELMDTVAASLERLFPGDVWLAGLLPQCRQTCDELAAIDQDSFAFRYPMDRKGQYSTRTHLTLNLASFAEHMSGILKDLSTVRFALSGEIDVTSDALDLALRR